MLEKKTPLVEMIDISVSFGGIKGSGLGREGVRIALREMSETKVVID